MTFYAHKRVLVTGGHGFLAAHVVPALLARGAEVRVAVRRNEPIPWASGEFERVVADLRDRSACTAAMKGVDLVFHLAAVGWGFHENLKRQPELLSENVLLNTTVLDSAWRAGASGVLVTSSSSVYPTGTVEFEESLSLDGAPHESEAGFAWSKRLVEIQARLYGEKYGLPVSIVRPTNPYGPWDNFHPTSSHVIPALMNRVLAAEDAGEAAPFTVWGTGAPLRSFVFAADAARAMLAAVERGVTEPVNLASPESTSIADLVRTLLRVAGHHDVAIAFDKSRPDGPARRVANVRRMQERLGITDFVTLEQGLAETLAWAREHRNELAI